MRVLDASTRVRLKNILFATDLSPAAAAALPFGVELARHFGGKVWALHVRNPEAHAFVSASRWNELVEQEDAQAREELKNLLHAFPGVETEVIIRRGETWPALASTIEKNEIDLIVIGTRGRTGVRKLVLGSVAEQILRQAPCPVLTVGPNLSWEPYGSWEPSEILYATDFSLESQAAMPYALSLAQEYEAHLALLHVIEEPRAGELLRPQELVASSLRLLGDIVPEESRAWCEPRFLVEVGEPAQKILDTVANNKASLIVLGAKKPTRIPGAATHLSMATAHKVVAHAPCPVLTVRA